MVMWRSCEAQWANHKTLYSYSLRAFLGGNKSKYLLLITLVGTLTVREYVDLTKGLLFRGITVRCLFVALSLMPFIPVKICQILAARLKNVIYSNIETCVTIV